MPQNLPTRIDVFTDALKTLDTARTGLSDARDTLASDTADIDTPPAAGELDAKREAQERIADAKNLLDQAKSALYRALELSES
ncbi:hypothetical protein [Nocardia sp. NBC_00511]|uniref:hypothetical protein n=1 Tax=Nocardia sp. NBC_00511 TaxID=2903591 RepID=UPI002F91508D